MIVLANKQRLLVQAANDEVAIERLPHGGSTVVVRDATMHCQEPSAAAHGDAIALWPQAPAYTPA